MRRIVLVLWLLVPVAAVAYHYGPGQKLLALDAVARDAEAARGHARRAAELEEKEGPEAAKAEWEKAELAFSKALGGLPEGRTAESRRFRLERSKAKMHIAKLPEANSELKTLVDEMVADESTDPVLLADARDAWANSQYYLTWLMRLEGQSRDLWEPEIDVARQTYKLLAQSHEQAGRTKALAKSKENLEAAIRLARRDLDELQGLPIPSQ